MALSEGCAIDTDCKHVMPRYASRVAALLLVLLACASCVREPREKQRLYEVYMPTFTRVPPRASAPETLETLSRDWRNGPGETFRRDLVSTQALIAVVALGIILLVAWDYKRPLNPRNIDALLMYGAGVCLFDCMRFFGVLTRPEYLTLLDWVFWGVFAIGLALLVRAVRRILHPLATPWTPNLGVRPLAFLAAILLVSNLFIVLVRPPDDAGWFVNLGAQRLRERGRLPYGDPLLTATPGAAYGPLLYIAHVPFQVFVAPDPVNQVSPSRPALDSGTPYYLPPLLATQLCTAFFHLVGVAALFLVGRRTADTRTALGLVCLYCGSLAVLGIGGSGDSVAGLTFVSHIAPAATTLLALAAIERPALSGVLLAVSTGIGFYPAFMAPAWLGHYWKDRSRRLGFLAGFGIAAIVIAVGVYATSRPAGERSRIGTILYDTFGHHTDPAGYGSSPFGFWGQRGGIRQVLSAPLVGSSGLTSPAWLAFLALIVGTFFLARGRSATDLALLAGAVAIGATLVKPHATGTYLAWYYPLLLVGIFAGGFTSRPQKV